MGRIFTITGENMSLGTGSVLAALQTASGVSAAAFLEILRVEVSQRATATAAQTGLVFSKRDTAGTLTTTSVTPQPQVVGGPASGLAGSTSVIGAVARSGINSSADSGGAYTDMWAVDPNNLNGYLWVPTQKERILVPPSTVWAVRFAAAPGTTTGWTIGIVFEELI